jgi:hypothetical protein
MERILLVVAIAFLYSSASLAADEDRASGGFQYTLVNYHEDVFDGATPTVWVGKYGQLTNENVTIEEKSLNDSQDRIRSVLGTSIGLGIAPFYGTYGVFRTSTNLDKSTYVAVGFILDELTMDEADTSDSWDDSGFSYGFGISNSSFNIEYMMSVDEENYDISAISLGFISEF